MRLPYVKTNILITHPINAVSEEREAIKLKWNYNTWEGIFHFIVLRGHFILSHF